MDATQFLPKKVAFFLAFALLAVTPWQARAQQLVVPASVSIPSVPGQATLLTVQSSNGTPISFTVSSVTYQNNGPTWLLINGTCIPGGAATTGTTGTASGTLSLGIGCYAGASGALNNAATITLTSTNPTGLSATIVVTAGGSITGTLTASPSSLSLCTSQGNTVTGVVVLQNNTGVPVSFTTAATPAWLAVSATSTSIPVGSTLPLSIQGIATSLANGNFENWQIQISYNSTTLNIPVAFTVSATCGSTGTGGMTLSPNTVSWSYSTASPASQYAPISVTTSSGATSYTANVTSISGGNWLSLSTNGASSLTSVSGPGGASVLTLQSSPYIQSLYTGFYQATVQVTDSNNNYGFIAVYLSVNGATSGGIASSVAPAALQFNYEQGVNQTLQPQQIMIGGSATYTVKPSASWLTTSVGSGTGQAPGPIDVMVDPSSFSPGGPYTGTVTVQFNDTTAPQTVAVNLLVVSATPLVYANPGTVIFNQQGATPSAPVYLFTTDNKSTLPITVTTATSWLSFISTPPTPSEAPGTFQVQASTSGLPNGPNTGSITVAYGANNTLTIPVVAYVTNSGVSGSGYLTFSPTTNPLAFSAPLGGTTTQSTTLYVSAGAATYFTATAVENSCTTATWLSINGLTSATVYPGSSQPVVVSVSPSNLQVGTCSGTIQFLAGGVTQAVAVTLTIGGTITLSPATQSASYNVGGSVPTLQSLTVTNTTAAAITYTAASSNNWLSVAPSGSVAANSTSSLAISLNSANLANLTAGQPYTGTITVTPSTGTPQTATVSLTVTATAVSATPSSLSFNFQAGGTTPSPQTVSVTGGSFSAAATSTGNWLSVSPASGTGATNLSVSVNQAGLAVSSIPYTGTITVTGTNGTTGTATVTVTLMVTAPLPTITAVQNAASGATGAVSPGEVIAISGTGLGPATPATLTLTSAGYVSTAIGGVTVTIGGTLAPLTYASSNQINAIVPYEVSGLKNPSLVVKYLGQTSNGYQLQTVAAAPGIFTLNMSGQGPGAILNQDYSVNGTSHPAAKGSVVQVFMTGEGQTSPGGTTGKVNNVTSASQLPVPLLPVSATVAGLPALVTFAGEAPGFVSGVSQVNVQIPTTVPSGNLQIVISVATYASPNGVSLVVQ